MSQFSDRQLRVITIHTPVVVLGGGLAGLTFTRDFLEMCKNPKAQYPLNPPALLLELRGVLGGRANPEDIACVDCLSSGEQLALPMTAPTIVGPEQVSVDHNILQSLLPPTGRRTKNNTSRRYVPQIWFFANGSWNVVDNFKAQQQDWFRNAFVRLESGVPPAGRAHKLLSDKNYQQEIFNEYWDSESGCYAKGFGSRTFQSTKLVEELVAEIKTLGATAQTGVSVTSIMKNNGLWQVVGTSGQEQLKASTETLVVATPSWKLRELQFEDPEISQMLVHLSEFLPGTVWPAKIVVELGCPIKLSGFNEYFLVGDAFCAQLWPHPENQSAFSGIICPVDGLELNLGQVYTSLIELFRVLDVSVRGVYILRVSEVFGGAYTFYPGEEAYKAKIEPVIRELADRNIRLVGDYVDLSSFGHANAAVSSAKKAAEDLSSRSRYQA